MEAWPLCVSGPVKEAWLFTQKYYVDPCSIEFSGTSCRGFFNTEIRPSLINKQPVMFPLLFGNQTVQSFLFLISKEVLFVCLFVLAF